MINDVIEKFAVLFDENGASNFAEGSSFMSDSKYYIEFNPKYYSQTFLASFEA